MRATVIYGAGDVRVETVPDPVIQRPTDALVRVVRACVFDRGVGLDGVPTGTGRWPSARR
jgi:hypothetical protein